MKIRLRVQNFLRLTKSSTLMITNRNGLNVKMALSLGMKSVFNYIRRHLIEIFSKINFSQSKTPMYFFKKIIIITKQLSIVENTKLNIQQ